MELLLHAIEEKLAHVTQERNRWLQYRTDHEKAKENLLDFQKSFRKEILVPIGSKALMPGTLYHTNEILVSMCSDLFVKCSADKALVVCEHRLKEAQKRLEALNVEYKMYKDRLDLSADEGIFGQWEEGQEIIEEYNEEREQEWRKKHRIRMRELKKREADERQRLLKDEGDKDYMAILEDAELAEELENELEELNIDSDDTLRTHLQCDQWRTSANLTEEQDDSGDEIASKKFLALSKQVANQCDSEKMKVYEKRLSQITDCLGKRNESNSKGFNEYVEMKMEKGNLEDAIEELREGINELSTVSSLDEKPKEVQPEAKPSAEPCNKKKLFDTVRDYEIYEKGCRAQNKSLSEILIFYKSQLRSLVKLLTGCKIDLTNKDDKTDLYEFICDRIDALRYEIHQEMQTKAEEDFVDDEDMAWDKSVDESDNAMDTDDDLSERRKISFASEPIIQTFDSDDEPWRVQMENNEENLNKLMDTTFQFFSDGSDGEEQCAFDSTNECVSLNPASVGASNTDCMESSGTQKSATLFIRFSHSPNECRPIVRDTASDAKIQNPLDIYDYFGGFDSDETKPNRCSESLQKSDKDTLKDYVMNVASLDTDTICRQMRENYEKRNAMKNSNSMENERLNVSSASSDIPNIGAKPKKSILKNRDAVSRETHQKIPTDDGDDAGDAEEEEEEDQKYGHAQPIPFGSQNESDESPFDVFTQVVGDIVERSDPSPEMLIASSNEPARKKRFSLFKKNRRS